MHPTPYAVFFFFFPYTVSPAGIPHDIVTLCLLSVLVILTVVSMYVIAFYVFLFIYLFGQNVCMQVCVMYKWYVICCYIGRGVPTSCAMHVRRLNFVKNKIK